MNPTYEKFDTNGDCKDCGFHITWHDLTAGEARCPVAGEHVPALLEEYGHELEVLT